MYYIYIYVLHIIIVARGLSLVGRRPYGGLAAADDLVKITFMDHEGNKHEVKGREGMNLVEVAQW